MSNRRFKRAGLVRTAGNSAPRAYTIVVCYDGERTEADYFSGWRSHLRAGAIDLRPILIDSGGSPEAAIERAIRAKNADADYDEYWCVCDVDGTSNEALNRAQQAATANEIQLAVSNRCFEVWVALHWTSISTAPIMSEKEARRLVAAHYGEYLRGPKVVPFSILYPLTSNAIANAATLRAAGTTNPSTRVDALVSAILARA